MHLNTEGKDCVPHKRLALLAPQICPNTLPSAPLPSPPTLTIFYCDCVHAAMLANLELASARLAQSQATTAPWMSCPATCCCHLASSRQRSGTLADVLLVAEDRDPAKCTNAVACRPELCYTCCTLQGGMPVISIGKGKLCQCMVNAVPCQPAKFCCTAGAWTTVPATLCEDSL